MRVLLAVDARRHACCCAQCECCCSRDARGAVRATAAVVKVGIDNSGAEIATAAAREGRGRVCVGQLRGAHTGKVTHLATVPHIRVGEGESNASLCLTIQVRSLIIKDLISMVNFYLKF